MIAIEILHLVPGGFHFAFWVVFFILLKLGLDAATRKWLRGYRYLLNGPRIIEEQYRKASGKAFTVQTPSNNHLMITSSELIQEVLSAAHGNLSLHAVAKELLQPKHTMHGFEWQDQRGVEGTGFVRALRSLLTSHLPHFQPQMDRIVRQCLATETSRVGEDGFSQVKLFPMVKRIVTRVNCFVFFGAELSENKEFLDAALELPQTIVLTAEVLRICPELLRPFVADLVTRRHRAARTLSRHLEPIVKERLAARLEPQFEGADKQKPVDCMQWLIDTSPRKDPWTPARMIGEIMAIWFSSVHQLAMATTFMIQDLCEHDDDQAEMTRLLRQEILDATMDGDLGSLDFGKLVLLDSFAKESMRHSNADAISCRRKALQPYIFKDGSRISRGDWVCIPQRAMMYDPDRYDDPTRFDAFRFARANDSLQRGQSTKNVPDKEPSTITTATVDWPLWGLGNTACPGRFYASLVFKVILAQILTEWECKMPAAHGARVMTWRSSVVPLEKTVVSMRKRQ